MGSVLNLWGFKTNWHLNLVSNARALKGEGQVGRGACSQLDWRRASVDANLGVTWRRACEAKDEPCGLSTGENASGNRPMRVRPRAL